MAFFGLFGPPNIEKLKAKRDVQGLIKALNYQKDARVQQAATDALAEVGDSQAIEPLLKVCDDPVLGNHATLALRKIGDARVIKPLVQHCKRALDEKQNERVDLINGTLEHILRRAAESIASENLQELVALNDGVIEIQKSYGCDHYIDEYKISFATVRQLARQELIRRGEKA